MAYESRKRKGKGSVGRIEKGRGMGAEGSGRRARFCQKW
jgi:hypothetical protein